MVRDGVANVVIRLQERGFDPRRVGHDSWEARCPVHRSTDYALSIARGEFNHVKLECRGTENCPYTRIIGALGLTNDHVYAETDDWLMSSLSRIPIQPASFEKKEDGGTKNEDGLGRVQTQPVFRELSANGDITRSRRRRGHSAKEIAARRPEVDVEPAGEGAAGVLVAGSMPCEEAVVARRRLGRSLAIPDNLAS